MAGENRERARLFLRGEGSRQKGESSTLGSDSVLGPVRWARQAAPILS